MAEVASRWASDFWSVYSAHPEYQRFVQLHNKAAHNPASKPPNPAERTQDEETAYGNLKLVLPVGFLVAGYVLPDRTPTAIEVLVDPIKGVTQSGPVVANWRAWGAPNMMIRLVKGFDSNLLDAILASGNWTGTPADLHAVLAKFELLHPILPIRDAVDFVHSCIHSTIKALKFSALSQTCGGPIEIAVITSDRKFRWVRHKPWDERSSRGPFDVRKDSCTNHQTAVAIGSRRGKSN